MASQSKLQLQLIGSQPDHGGARHASSNCYYGKRVVSREMHKALVLGLVFAAAGCAQPPEPAPTDTPTVAANDIPESNPGAGVPQSFAGTAWRAQGEDGSLYTTYIDADGTYRDLRNGDPWQTGKWTYDLAGENRLCFTPDDENGAERCWRPERMHGAALDVIGGVEARRVELEPVEYAAADVEGQDPT